jgi:hypothetical protein
MLSKIKSAITCHLTNIPGWRTNRKIVVIESDDWGSIRMPSRQVYEKCLSAGYRVDEIAYERYDSLLSETDLELLFNLLSSYKDSKGHSPIITANVLTSNPDFEKIKLSGFKKYYYESIEETFKSYPEHSNCLNLWEKGMEDGLFFPQSHGREHLNVSMFMNALQRGDKDVHFGFKYKMPGSIPHGSSASGNKYVAALLYDSLKDKEEKLSIVLEGLELFENLFGFRSESFIPPNYKWSPDFNEQMAKNWVRFFQGNKKMAEPQPGGKKHIHSHYLGEMNEFGQTYLVRNARFEPSLADNRSVTVDQCLSEIKAAFRMKKPAIICTHRINYVGFIDETNRDQNLRLLDQLLKKITLRWPDVEFMNSVQLGKIIMRQS